MTLLGYLSRIFVLRFLFCLFGLAALLQLLDLLDNATEALGRGGVGALARYALLRFPSIVNQVVPVAVLLGALATLLVLARQNEIVAMRSSGVSLYRVTALLVPVTLVIGLLHFTIGDQVAPRAERFFQDWWVASAPPGAGEQRRPRASLWLRQGTTLVSMQRVGEQGRLLESVEIFARAPSGHLVARTTAAWGEFGDGGWTLSDVRQTVIANNAVVDERHEQHTTWQTSLLPGDFVALAAPTETLSARTLFDIVAGRRPAAAGAAFYETRVQRKFALPFASLVMLLVAAPAAMGHRGVSRGIGLGLAVGFLYLITDGLATAAGQARLLPALLAAWVPTLAFASIGATGLIWLEDKG